MKVKGSVGNVGREGGAGRGLLEGKDEGVVLFWLSKTKLSRGVVFIFKYVVLHTCEERGILLNWRPENVICTSFYLFICLFIY